MLKQKLRIVQQIIRILWIHGRSSTSLRDLILPGLGLLRQFEVKIVAVKLGLHIWLSETGQVLLEIRLVNVFPLLVDVTFVVVLLASRFERSWDRLLVETFPVEVSEPRVVLDFLSTVEA